MDSTTILSIAIPIIVNIIAFVFYDMSNKKIFQATVEESLKAIKKDVLEIEEDVKDIKKVYVPRVELSGEFKNIYKRIDLIDKKVS
tara:strand:- start:461 stop:718 length:258 start_codon:yes stop_codon:yes gene_type:complete